MEESGLAVSLSDTTADTTVNVNLPKITKVPTFTAY